MMVNQTKMSFFNMIKDIKLKKKTRSKENSNDRDKEVSTPTSSMMGSSIISLRERLNYKSRNPGLKKGQTSIVSNGKSHDSEDPSASADLIGKQLMEKLQQKLRESMEEPNYSNISNQSKEQTNERVSVFSSER